MINRILRFLKPPPLTKVNDADLESSDSQIVKTYYMVGELQCCDITLKGEPLLPRQTPESLKKAFPNDLP